MCGAGRHRKPSAGMRQGCRVTRWVVLLSGVNVGGANRLPMSYLRDLVGSLGHSDVVTYIQSGNLLLTSTRKDRAKIGAEICEAITSSFGLAVTAILRTSTELRASVASNPFSAEAKADAA